MVKNIAIVSLSSGTIGEAFAAHEVEIGIRRLKEYGLNVIMMPHAQKGIEYVKNHPEDRAKDFLQAFSEKLSGERKGSLAAFCVMGGIFGEGIDLKNEQLIGAIVVGTGLPQISNEREILMGYFEKRLGAGFDYAYRYPGMNKVLQAAGRVIRTVEDVGVIELLDERFLQSEYRALFPREWERQTVCRIDTVEKYLEEFWNRS